jgi:hypothetical protein
LPRTEIISPETFPKSCRFKYLKKLAGTEWRPKVRLDDLHEPDELRRLYDQHHARGKNDLTTAWRAPFSPEGISATTLKAASLGL